MSEIEKIPYVLNVINVAQIIKCAVCGSCDFPKEFEYMVEWLDWRVNDGWEPTRDMSSGHVFCYDYAVKRMAESALRMGQEYISKCAKEPT